MPEGKRVSAVSRRTARGPEQDGKEDRMKKLLRLLTTVGIGILATAVACQSTPDVQSSPDEEETAAHEEGIRITVSRNGFDGSRQFRIEVEEGEEVEITFVYGDGNFSQNNPHVIEIPALGLTTGVIDRQNLEETVRFTAAETGEIMFMCTQVDCVGHANLVTGTIDVEQEGHQDDEEHN